jgi:antitoxin HicB
LVVGEKIEKDLEYYMSLPYEVLIRPSDGGWFAKIPDLPGCMTYSESFEELLPLIEDAKRGYIEVSLEHGDPVREPSEVLK